MSSNKLFEIENEFYAKTKVDRINKIVVHYELYKKVYKLDGDILEFGVFKGTSIIQWASFREILGRSHEQKIIGFDTFDKFPETNFEKDKDLRKQFVNEAGLNSTSKASLEKIFNYKEIKNFNLVEGDILKTLPNFMKENNNLRIALLHIDVDIYEPTKIILDELYDKVVDGGIIILDDYKVFPGETKAVDDFVIDKDIQIQQLPFSPKKPSFFIKK
tara:strand:+ start:2569 stop:3219 length:651 start_codon:yes stop_codon:yes gene_type:complete